MLAIIVALTENRVIGKDGKLPWHSVEELKNFKQLTTDHKIIFGRKTFDSIGKSLPNRTVFILTRQKNYKPPYEVTNPYKIFNDSNKLIKKFALVKSIVFVGGGAEIFKIFLPYCKYLYISKMKKEYNGDTYFPEIDFDDYEPCFTEDNPDFKFLIYKKKTPITLN